MNRQRGLLISAAIGTMYLGYMIWSFVCFRLAVNLPSAYFGTLLEDGFEGLSAVVALMMISAHQLLLILAVIMNWVAWIWNKRYAMIGSGTLYTLSGLALVAWLPYVMVEVVLCFLGAKRKHRERNMMP